MQDMRVAKTISRTEKTVDLKAWNELLESSQAYGRSNGITSEEEVDRMLGEFRTTWRSTCDPISS